MGDADERKALNSGEMSHQAAVDKKMTLFVANLGVSDQVNNRLGADASRLSRGHVEPTFPIGFEAATSTNCAELRSTLLLGTSVERLLSI